MVVWLYQIPYAHRMAVNQSGGNYDHTAVFFAGLLAMLVLHIRLIITDRLKILALTYPIINICALVAGSMYFYFAAGGPE